MIDISYRLRTSLISAISPLTYLGVTIPIFELRVNPSSVIPTVAGGEAFVLINGQTTNETTNDKCQIRVDANINFDVVTRFPAGVGGSLNAEKISELIMAQVNRSLNIPNFKLINVTMNFNRNLPEFGTSQDAFRKIISYRFDLFEN